MTDPRQDAQQPILLKERTVAEILNLSVRTLQKWRCTGEGPPFVRISSRAVRYHREDIEAWVRDHMRSSTSDDGYAS